MAYIRNEIEVGGGKMRGGAGGTACAVRGIDSAVPGSALGLNALVSQASSWARTESTGTYIVFLLVRNRGDTKTGNQAECSLCMNLFKNQNIIFFLSQKLDNTYE